MAFIKAKKTAWNTERGMALLYEDDPKNGVIIPIDALPPLGAHARRVIAGVQARKGQTTKKLALRPGIGARRHEAMSRTVCRQDRRRKSEVLRCIDAGEPAADLLNSRHGVFAEAHAGHRARGIEVGVGFAFRKIGAWRRGRRGSLHAEEERAVRRPGQGRSARFCASSTATSAARHEPVPIIEA